MPDSTDTSTTIAVLNDNDNRSRDRAGSRTELFNLAHHFEVLTDRAQQIEDRETRKPLAVTAVEVLTEVIEEALAVREQAANAAGIEPPELPDSVNPLRGLFGGPFLWVNVREDREDEPEEAIK